MFKNIISLLNSSQKSARIKVSGLTSSGTTYLSAILTKESKSSVILVVDDTVDLPHISEEMEFWTEILHISAKVYYVPGRESMQRPAFLYNLLHDNHKKIVIINSSSVKDMTISEKNLLNEIVKVSVGAVISRALFIEKMALFGFSQEDEISQRGEFSIRGEIVDIWPHEENLPMRVLFDEDTIESIYSFDPVTQRSKAKAESFDILQANERPDVSIFSYFPQDEYILCYGSTYSKDFEDIFSIYKRVSIEPFAHAGIIDCAMQPMINFQGNWDFFVREFKRWIEDGYAVTIVAYSEGELKRLTALLSPDVTAEHKVLFYRGYVRTGFIAHSEKIVVVTEHEIFNRYKDYDGRVLETRVTEDTDVFKDTDIDYKVGDYVVHSKYGIGKFLGLNRVASQDSVSDFITIEYAGRDKLYVPLYDFTLVHRYVRQDDFAPVLHILGKKTWERAKERVAKRINEMAKQIIEMQAKRKTIKGIQFSLAQAEEKEFADSFIYEETPDQKRAINDVLKDMDSSAPMERLVCGDVGYGKTEVALRASFRAVMNSRQVVMLVPTTLLCEQHFNTFKERFADYPINVAMLSRFRSEGERKEVRKSLGRGDVDVVISTHGILRDMPRFANLGLVIVDEEHRFGVKDKERLKDMSAKIDILMLSATPIPRTLSMAMSGIRDISVIETPPPSRKSITTYIGPYDPQVVRDALVFEKRRDGQVFYVYNNVERMKKKYDEILHLVPDARVAIAHGQMHNSDLERVMHAFLNREIDVLLATTIVESGLDIPSVNMMIIDGVESLGLAQLYQLRGRVGRGFEKAFCYMLFPQGVTLSDNAIKRLKAVQEFAGLGAGFKLALRDLEIRGAGNLLGREQHGYIKEIGFELYCSMLNKALHEFRDGEGEDDYNPELQINARAYFPDDYIKSPSLRIGFYKALLSCNSKNDINNINEELVDRFGPIPRQVSILLLLAEVRILAKHNKIALIQEQKTDISINFRPDAEIPVEKLIKMAENMANNFGFDPANERTILIKNISKNDIEKLNTLKKLLQAIG
ncbi:MAG: transcription-repair coupling factor [Elusimicrobiota bacterium]